MNVYFTLAFAAAFCLFLALVYALQYWFHRRRLIEETVAPLFMTKKRKSVLGRLGDRFDRSSQGLKMEQQIQEMSLPLRPSEWMAFRLFFYLSLFMIGVQFFGLGLLLSMVLSPLVVEVGTRVFYRYRKALYLQRIDEQLPEVCRLLGNAVRAGQSIQQGLQTVARVVGDPLGPHFRAIVNQLALGVKLEQVFEQMQERLPSRELRLFFSTVLIQKETGGNLSQVMDQMADTLKQRQIVEQAIRTSTAEGRYTSVLLPLLGLGFLFIFGQAYDLQELLVTPIGILITLVFLAGQVIGFLMVRKMSKVEV